MKTASKLSAAAIVLLCASSLAALSATTTTNLAVTATVLDACIVTAPNALVFGDLSAAAASNETIPGSIVITCTAAKTGLSVVLGGGANAASGQRQMADGGANRVPYNIFSDAGRTSSVAVDGTFYTGNVAAATPVTRTVYGQVPAGSYNVGLYTDTVLVTLNY